MLLAFILVVLLPVLGMGVYFIEDVSSLLITQRVEREEQALLQLRSNIQQHLSRYIDISHQFYLNKLLPPYFNTLYTNPGKSAEGFYSVLSPHS